MAVEKVKARRGLTLIELVVVVGLLSLVFTIAIANLDYMLPRYRLRGAAREVGDLAKLAKSRAVATGRDVYLQYDLTNQSYWMLSPVEKEEQGRKKIEYERAFFRQLPENVEFVSVVVSRDVRYERGGTATIRISPFGFGGGHIVNLTNEEHHAMAVKVNGFTGSLTFFDEEKDADEMFEDTEY